ncbi:MAG: XdhC family protein [Chloroflexi bacterium]|nr:XdhC family protein [Chloroflexota bacterium]
MADPIVVLSDALQREQPAVLATVVEVKGASPAKAGTQIVLLSDGTTAGTVGGGRLEAAILADGRLALDDGEPRLTHYRLVEDGPEAIGVLCGGEVRVFLQAYRPPPRLIIAGGGHIGRALKQMAGAAGFAVTVVVVEPGRAEALELEAVTFTEDTSVVLLTTDHISDAAALRKVIGTPVPYIGMIGSSAKCVKILGELRNEGYDEAALARVYAPVGLDLGGPTPGEIAAAILAKIITVRRGGSGRSRSRHK